ncbi:hypothetical protein TNCV_2152351 [Trichonephila clavipes]|nr:hypothetical protein TNCV_2152351 [Trichonephila clavipes]
MAPHTITPSVEAVCRVQFPRAWHHSKRRRRWVSVKGRTRNGCHDPKSPSSRHLRMVRENTGPLVKALPIPGWRPMKQLSYDVVVFSRTVLSRAS